MEMMMRQQRIWQSSKYRLHEIQMTLSEYCDFQCSFNPPPCLCQRRCSGLPSQSHAHVNLSDE